MISQEVFMEIKVMSHRGISKRSIAKTLGIHRDTVTKHLADDQLPRTGKVKGGDSILVPYHQIINDYLEDDDYKATWIFDRLRMIDYPGSYETLKNYVRDIKEQKTRLAYARFETEPGLQAQCDWGDFQIEEPNGKSSTVYAFVLLLGYSRAMYVEFVRCCTLEAFMDCHVHAFHYLQGSPLEILYDNMKNVVLARSPGKAVFNMEFSHLAHHYVFQPRVAPPYSPWVKGKVERPMDFIRERFWRGYSYTSVERTNEDILSWLNETANSRIHGTHRQPVQERWQQEINYLGKLPPRDYDTSIKAFRRVYKDCQLSYDGNRYQVPHRAVGKKVMLKIKHNLVRIYHDQDLLATYQQPEGKGQTIGDPRIYEALKNDKEQIARKYGNRKGKATRGLTTSSLYVSHRPLSEYEKYSQGGVVWSN